MSNKVPIVCWSYNTTFDLPLTKNRSSNVLFVAVKSVGDNIFIGTHVIRKTAVSQYVTIKITDKLVRIDIKGSMLIELLGLYTHPRSILWISFDNSTKNIPSCRIRRRYNILQSTINSVSDVHCNTTTTTTFSV